MAVYDATNPEARAYYWDLIDKGAVQDRRRRLVDGHHRAGNRGPRENILLMYTSWPSAAAPLRQHLTR
jgi:hypothetical protein